MEAVIRGVGDYLNLQAERMGDVWAVKEAISSNAKNLTYKGTTFKELETETNRLSHFLKKKGIERGMKVLVLVRPGLELIRIVFALFKMGSVPVIIDPGMGLKNFLACVRQVQPQGLIAIPAAYWLSKVFLNTFKSIKVSIKVTSGFFKKEQLTDPLPQAIQQNDLAAILFTSGSTGSPKGVEYEHGMLMAQVEMIRETYGIEPGEVDFPMLPVFALFNVGLGVTTMVPQMNPSRPAKADPAKLVRALLQEKVTNTFGSPAVWSSIVPYCEKNDICFQNLKRVLIAGAPVEVSLVERLKKLLPHGEVFTPYGATEALPMTSISGAELLKCREEKNIAGKGICVGRALKGVDVRILSIQSNEELKNGEIGEIVVKGPSVTKQYHGLMEATKKAKLQTKEGLWHRMGDIGYIDAEGRIWICGRVVEVVTTDVGKKFYPVCCESIFNQHPAVHRTALIGIGEGKTLEPAVVIEFKNTKNIQTKKVLEELKVQAKAYAMTEGIKYFLTQKRLPVDVRHNAKIHRLKLSKLYTKKLGVK